MKAKKKGRASTKDAVIGRKLREIRYWRRFSQEALAAKVDITFQQLQKYENGTNRISASRLHDLSKILDVTIADFFVDLETGAEGNNALPVQPRKATVALMQSYERFSKEDKEAVRLFFKVMSN